MNAAAVPLVSPEKGIVRRGSEAEISASWRRWSRPAVGASILGVLMLQLGTEAFVGALRSVDLGALALGAVVAAVTTAAAAWRWRVVARQLGVDLSMSSAVAACYRSQFLNVTLPGGVLGDIHRGVRHGGADHDLGVGLRAVAWERTTGQVVLAVATAGVLAAHSPVGPVPLVVAVVALGVSGVLLLGLARASPVVSADARRLGSPSLLFRVVAASLVTVAGHVVVFALAARSAGVRMPVGDLVPLALVVLVVAAAPLNLAGWGPREGGAAWAFSAAGATATQGVTVAVVFGVLVLVGTLPGAVLLFVGRRQRACISGELGGQRTGPRGGRTAHGFGRDPEVTVHD